MIFCIKETHYLAILCNVTGRKMNKLKCSNTSLVLFIHVRIQSIKWMERAISHSSEDGFSYVKLLHSHFMFNKAKYFTNSGFLLVNRKRFHIQAFTYIFVLKKPSFSRLHIKKHHLALAGLHQGPKHRHHSKKYRLFLSTWCALRLDIISHVSLLFVGCDVNKCMAGDEMMNICVAGL